MASLLIFKESVVVRNKALIDEDIKASNKLEAIRLESRKARAKLIECIMCDRKDVLAESEKKSIRSEFNRFFEVQTRLSKAWYESCNTSAKASLGLPSEPED